MNLISRAIRVTGALGVAAALVFSASLGAGSAFALDNDPSGAKSDCYYKSQRYSHGSQLRQDDGALYKCDNGSWVWQCSCPPAKITTRTPNVIIGPGTPAITAR